MDYAILSGGDVAPLGGGAVTQLHSTFDWAERSRRGLLLFIDEADAFLGRRNDEMSEGLRGALNALLFRTGLRAVACGAARGSVQGGVPVLARRCPRRMHTCMGVSAPTTTATTPPPTPPPPHTHTHTPAPAGDQSRDFMVVLATNRPGDLDDAVLDRMDEAIHFDLPGREQRLSLLQLYLDKYIAKAGTAEVRACRVRAHARACCGGRAASGCRARHPTLTPPATAFATPTALTSDFNHRTRHRAARAGRGWQRQGRRRSAAPAVAGAAWAQAGCGPHRH
jgi:hypothetical protein